MPKQGLNWRWSNIPTFGANDFNFFEREYFACLKKIESKIVCRYRGAQYRKMSYRIQNESLSHLEKHEFKQQRTERQRTVTQCNKAYRLLEELGQQDADFIIPLMGPEDACFDSRYECLSNNDIWTNVKEKTKRLKEFLEDFKDKHKDDEYYIKKIESALRNAEKNIIKSVRRSKRIQEIRKAKKRFE